VIREKLLCAAMMLTIFMCSGAVASAECAPEEMTEGDVTTSAALQLTLEEALVRMTTESTQAETADLNRKADQAVAKGYSEQYQRINKVLDAIDSIEGIPDATIQDMVANKLGYQSLMDMIMSAQEKGVTSGNKKIMSLRRNFANENADNNFTADINQIKQDTINLYGSVLLAEENYRIAMENLTSQQKLLMDVQAKKNVGLLSKKDVLQAKSSVTEAEKEVRSAKTMMENAHMSLNYLLGCPVLQKVILTDELSATTEEAIDTEEAVKKGLSNRNEIRGADFARDIYQLLFEQVKDYPKNSATYLTAQVRSLEAEKTSRDARAKIEIDVRNKAAQLQDKRAALDAAIALRDYAAEGLRLVKLTNEQGLSTVQEVLNAQVSYYKADLNVVKAISEYNLSAEAFKNAQSVGTMRIPL